MAPALKLAPPLRNTLERQVAKQLTDAGIAFQYEPRDRVVRYAVPSRIGRYLPDFVVGNGIIIETKGWFQTHDRQKIALIKEQFPTLDLRLVFQRATNKISKTSTTTYAKWCDDHGILWSDKGVVPKAWIKQMMKGK